MSPAKILPFKKKPGLCLHRNAALSYVELKKELKRHGLNLLPAPRRLFVVEAYCPDCGRKVEFDAVPLGVS